MAKSDIEIPIVTVADWAERLTARASKQVVVSSYSALMRQIAAHMESCFAAGHSIDDVLKDAREAGIDEDALSRDQLERAYAQYLKKNGKGNTQPKDSTAQPPKRVTNGRGTGGSNARSEFETVDPLNRADVSRV